MTKSIILALIGCLSLIYISCAPKASGLPGAKGPETEEKTIQKPAQEAWEMKWEKTLAQARKEGKIVLYISGGLDTVKALIKPMKERFWVDMEYVVGKGAQVSAKVIAERNAGLHLFDVFVSGFSTLTERLDPVGALDPLDAALIFPDIKDKNTWWGGEIPFINDKKTGLTFVGVVNEPILFNTNLVRKEEITSYWDLLNPKWKEKIGFYDPTVSGGANTFFTIASMKLVGLDFFKELAKQKPSIIQNNRLIVEGVARGKYLIGLGVSEETVAELIRAGAPLGQLTPREGTYISSSGGNIGLVNMAPHPNAARVFINFLLSKEGQDLWAVNEGVQSLRLDATVEHLSPEARRQPGIDYILSDKGEVREKREYYREIAKEVFALK